MAQMSYFRRPDLAGNNLGRIPYATVRGTVRRSEPDGSSTQPYFPGVTASQTLNITVDGTPYVATFASSAMFAIIQQINTVLGANGKASETDGTLSIQTLTTGGEGSIKVTGGTAALALGFDISKGEVSSVGGEIASAPEGRIGNWQGVAFPNKSSNLSLDIINNALGRLSGNQDVLYADLVRPLARRFRLTSGITVSADRRVLTLPGSAKVFTGLGKLSNASGADELSSFFQVFEQGTGRPAAQKVVAVCIGNPASPYTLPISNAADFSATGNILGQDVEKGSFSITSIAQGKFVKCASADFPAAGVVVGDFVEVTDATNNSPFSNNGYRWVVESIPAADTLVLRPMSLGEYTAAGTTVGDYQPVLELNSTLTGGESFGSLTVKTGTFCTGVKLVLDRALALGANPELWVALASDYRHQNTYEQAEADGAYGRLFLPPATDSVPGNWLSGLTGSLGSGTTFNTTAGYIRWRGRAQYVPASANNYATAGLTIPGGQYYVYWGFDHATGLTGFYVSTLSWQPSANFVGSSQVEFLYRVDFDSGTGDITTLKDLRRSDASDVRSITVGVGGQFATLGSALNYLEERGNKAGDTELGDSLAKDESPHAEIVLVSDVSSGAVNVVMPGLKIRGANSRVSLIMTGPITASATITIEDLLLVWNDATAGRSFINAQSPGNTTAPFHVTLKNVRQLSTGTGTMGHVVGGVNSTTTGGLVDKVIINHCNFTSSIGVVWTGGALGGAGNAPDKIYLQDSVFTQSTAGVACGIIHTASPNYAMSGTIRVTGCKFSGWTNPLINYILTGVLVGISGSATCDAVISENVFTFGTITSYTDCRLVMGASSKIRMSGNTYTNRGPSLVYGDEAIVNDNYLITGNGLDVLISCATACNNTVITTGATTKAGILISVTKTAMGNYIIGEFTVGIAGGVGTTIVGNNIRDNGVLSNAAPTAIQGGTNISGNFIVISTANGKGIDVLNSATYSPNIANNSINVATATASAVILVRTSQNIATVLDGNTFNSPNASQTDVQCTGSQGVALYNNIFKSIGTSLTGNVGVLNLTNNFFGGTVSPTFISSPGTSIVSGNTFDKNTTLTNCTVTGNIFNASSTLTDCQIVGNKWIGSGTCTVNAYSATYLVDSLLFEGNSVQTSTVTTFSWNSYGQHVYITGNYFKSGATGANATSTDTTEGCLFISNNTFGTVGGVATGFFRGFRNLTFTNNMVYGGDNSTMRLSSCTTPSLSWIGGKTVVTGNYFSASTYVDGWNELVLSGNTFINRAQIIAATSAANGYAMITDNKVFTASGSGSTYYFNVGCLYATIKGNRFDRAFSFYGGGSALVFDGNYISDTYNQTSYLSGTDVYVTNNKILNTVNLSALHCVFSFNYVAPAGTGYQCLEISGDTSNDASSSWDFTSNTFTANMGAVANGSPGITFRSALRFGLGVTAGYAEIFRNVRIQGNFIRVMASSLAAHAYLSAIGLNAAPAGGFGGFQRLSMQDNIIEMPAFASDGPNFKINAMLATNNGAFQACAFGNNTVFKGNVNGSVTYLTTENHIADTLGDSSSDTFIDYETYPIKGVIT